MFIAVLAVVADVKCFKIPNRLIIAGFIVDLLIIMVAFLNKVNVLVYVGGIGTGFLISIVLYVVKAIGAGDAKLLSVMGGMIGIDNIIHVIILSLVLGGFLGVSEMLLKTGKNVDISINYHPYSGKHQHAFHYSIGILISVCLVLLSEAIIS